MTTEPSSGWIRRQQFDPGPLGFLVNPFFLARRALRKSMLALAPADPGRTLDVGCGRRPYRSLFATQDYTGIEIDTPETRERGWADVYYDGTKFPFDDASFDTILCNQVLEHVFNPDEFIAEVARVLAPGGQLLLTVPFVWDEHEQPWDYARYSSFGLKALLASHGLNVIRHDKTLPNLALLGQLQAGYFYKLTVRHGWVVRAIGQALLVAPSLLLGWLAGAIIPDNRDLYLDNVILARRS